MSERLLTIRQVEDRVGFRKSTIYARMAAGRFPRAHRDPETGSVRWLESEVSAWIAEAVCTWPAVGTVAGSDEAGNKKAA